MSFRIHLSHRASISSTEGFLGASALALAIAPRVPTVECDGVVQNRAELEALVDGLTAAGQALWPKTRSPMDLRKERPL
jgi:hypothetical protein